MRPVFAPPRTDQDCASLPAQRRLRTPAQETAYEPAPRRRCIIGSGCAAAFRHTRLARRAPGEMMRTRSLRCASRRPRGSAAATGRETPCGSPTDIFPKDCATCWHFPAYGFVWTRSFDENGVLGYNSWVMIGLDSQIRHTCRSPSSRGPFCAGFRFPCPKSDLRWLLPPERVYVLSVAQGCGLGSHHLSTREWPARALFVPGLDGYGMPYERRLHEDDAEAGSGMPRLWTQPGRPVREIRCSARDVASPKMPRISERANVGGIPGRTGETSPESVEAKAERTR